jgi:diacylglycerol kinase family enzyme
MARTPTVGPFGPLAVIADPRAGDGRVRRELPVLERALRARGLDHTVSIASTSEDATGLAAAALDDGYRFLVAVGDDGTVQDVVNGMFRDREPLVHEPVLGVVAANSGCDLVRSFGLPGDVEGACGHLAGANTYPMDVVRISYTVQGGERRTRYSHNIAEAGFGAEVARRMARLPARLGNARRFLAFWIAFAGTRRVDLKVEADRKTYEGPCFDVVVANAQFSGGLRLSPRSFPGDGVLDVLVFRGPRSDAYTLLPRIFRHGDHIPDQNIQEMRAKIRVAVDAERPLPLVADGRPLGVTPAVFEIMPRSILLKL